MNLLLGASDGPVSLERVPGPTLQQNYLGRGGWTLICCSLDSCVSFYPMMILEAESG